MKKLILFLLLPNLSFAYSKIDCSVVERYNDQRIESVFSVAIDESAVAVKVVAGQKDANLRFVTYYSKDQDLFGARIVDDNLGVTAGNFIEPSKEKTLVKVRYIKTKPESQLFALDCVMK